MSPSETKVSPPDALDAASPTAAPEPVSSQVALPAWAEAYLAHLRTNFHKPDAARAAGIDLVSVVELRETNPDFATRERRVMSAYADILEAEALRRATSTPVPGPDGKLQRPLGSDRLLLRLMEHFIPGFAPARKTPPSAASPRKPGKPASPADRHPAQRFSDQSDQSDQSDPSTQSHDTKSASRRIQAIIATLPDDVSILKEKVGWLTLECDGLLKHRMESQARIQELDQQATELDRCHENAVDWIEFLYLSHVKAGLPIPYKNTAASEAIAAALSSGELNRDPIWRLDRNLNADTPDSIHHYTASYNPAGKTLPSIPSLESLPSFPSLEPPASSPHRFAGHHPP